MTDKKKKSDEEILFPDIKVGDLVIKPWSFGKLFDLSLLLDQIMVKAEARGILEDIDDGFLKYTTMMKIFALSAPEILEIVCITVGKDEDYIKSLSMPDGIKIALSIYNQNVEIIKNAFALLTLANVSEEEEKAGN